MRLRFRRHPRYDTLSLHADRELPASESMELNVHLAGCSACREKVEFMVVLGQRLQDLPTPALPPGLLDEILRRRALGEQRLLPTDDPPVELESGGNTSRTAGAVGAALLLAAVSFVFFSPSRIEAGSSRLELEPGPTPGSPIQVEFRTAGAGANARQLTLRGEYFTLSDPIIGGREGTFVEAGLSFDEPGRFVGTVQLPPQAIYARFVVEDGRGEVVARDPAWRWEYYERGADGEPTFKALWRRVELLHIEAPDLAREALSRLLELYLDRPEAWRFQWFFDRTSARSLTAIEDHEARLSAFMRDLPADPHPDVLAHLAQYAGSVGNTGVETRLLARLEQLEPSHPVLAVRRIARIAALGRSPEPFLAAFEAEWTAHGNSHPVLLDEAFGASIRLGDPAAALRWATRYRTARPRERGMVARHTAQVPELREVAAGWLRDELRELSATPGFRPLGRSADAHHAARQRSRAELLAALGDLLAAGGDSLAAADTLALAAEVLWDPDLFHRVAELYWSLGWQASATTYLLRAAVDPLDGEEHRAHALDRLALLGVEGETLESDLELARAEFRDRLFGDATVPTRVHGSILVRSSTGEIVDLQTYLAGRVTIVKFWSPNFGSSGDEVAELLRDCEQFAARGIRILPVAVDALGSARSVVDSTVCDTPILIDESWEARDRLRVQSLAETIVIDSKGFVRARPADPDEARRVALVLTDSK